MMTGTDGSEGDTIHKEFDELEKAGISQWRLLYKDHPVQRTSYNLPPIAYPLNMFMNIAV